MGTERGRCRGKTREEVTVEGRPVRTMAGEAGATRGRVSWKPATLVLGHTICDSVRVTDGRIE